MAVPTVGEPYKMGEQVIIPTYVRESEAPRPDGGCVTANVGLGGTIDAEGWYVEFHYGRSAAGTQDTNQYRDFVPFPAELAHERGEYCECPDCS